MVFRHSYDWIDGPRIWNNCNHFLFVRPKTSLWLCSQDESSVGDRVWYRIKVHIEHWIKLEVLLNFKLITAQQQCQSL